MNLRPLALDSKADRRMVSGSQDGKLRKRESSRYAASFSTEENKGLASATQYRECRPSWTL